jgi:hypothetical protein
MFRVAENRDGMVKICVSYWVAPGSNPDPEAGCLKAFPMELIRFSTQNSGFSTLKMGCDHFMVLLLKVIIHCLSQHSKLHGRRKTSLNVEAIRFCMRLTNCLHGADSFLRS